MTKNADFGPNLAVFGPKILIFMGVSKSFGTTHNRKPPRQLVCFVSWSGLGSNGSKRPIFGKSQFWAKNPGSKTFSTLISGNQRDTLFVLKTLVGEAPLTAEDKNVQF